MAQVKLLRQDIQRALKQSDDSHALAELKLAKAVLEGHGPGGDLRKLLKQPTPALLKLLLGQHCNVMTLQVPPGFSHPEHHSLFTSPHSQIDFLSPEDSPKESTVDDLPRPWWSKDMQGRSHKKRWHGAQYANIMYP